MSWDDEKRAINERDDCFKHAYLSKSQCGVAQNTGEERPAERP